MFLSLESIQVACRLNAPELLFLLKKDISIGNAVQLNADFSLELE